MRMEGSGWRTAFGFSLCPTEKNWRACVTPQSEDVVVQQPNHVMTVNGEDVQVQHPDYVIHVNGRAVLFKDALTVTRAAHWIQTSVINLLLMCDPHVVQLLATVVPATMQMLRVMIQIHPDRFNQCMKRSHPFHGFDVLSSVLNELGPAYMAHSMMNLYDCINSTPLVPSEAILPPPEVWKTELLPHQKQSLLWMQCFEAGVASHNFVQLPMFCEMPGTEYVFCFFTKQFVPAACVTSINQFYVPYGGGILADGIGTGKTAVALALVAASPKRMSDPNIILARASIMTRSPFQMTRALCTFAHRVPTTASLIVLPYNLCKQWEAELDKFAHIQRPTGTGLRVVRVFNKRDYESVSMRSVSDADIVLTTFNFLQGTHYSRYVRGINMERVCQSYSNLVRHDELRDMHPLLFQALYWRRIIYDEQHEIGGTRSMVELLNSLRGEVLWGLTATPNLEQERANFIFNLNADALSLFPLYQHQLIHHTVRRTCSSVGDERRIHTHDVMVPINDMERGLLETYRNCGLEAHVQLATCFNVVALFGVRPEEDVHIETMTFENLARFMTEKHDRACLGIQAEVSGIQVQIENYQSLLEQHHATEDSESDVTVVRMFQRQLKLHKRRLDRKQMEVTELTQQRNFFQAQLSEEVKQCPICFEDSVNVVGVCGHWFCKSCVTSYFKNQGAVIPCPVCKRETRHSDWVSVLEQAQSDEGGASRRGDMEHDYGSKLFAIVTLLKSLKQRGEKAIMFLQWSNLLKVVKTLLVKGGVDAVAVFGNSNMVSSALNKFSSGQADVLLLSLETATTGLNLVMANHVIFAHALVNVSPRQHTDYVQQAIGRVNRLGQTKEVHVHWFIAEGTDEQRLFDTQRL